MARRQPVVVGKAMTFLSRLLAASVLLALPVSAHAWGYKGHEVIAGIARFYLTPAARAKVDALLATDTDTLTKPDMLSRATWADVYRGAGHRETAEWHFVDIELDHPDLAAACFAFPPAGGPASAGPAEDCVVNKVDEFEAELSDPATRQLERVLALKYLLHFVGDLHQPLHAADNHDKGGNCVRLALGGPRTVNLHSYWDTVVVDALGDDPQQIADRLRAAISASDKAQWEKGDPRSWAMESFAAAKTAYSLNPPAGCDPNAAPVAVPVGYDAAARQVATVQLERAGVRLAALLNRALP
jgi:hypothetical protein